MKQFGRVLQLKIGNKEESIVINNLRVSFDVRKTITQEPNTATVSIYNLNASHRNLITQNIYNFIELSVCYADDDLRLIFCGDVIEVMNNLTDCNIITTLKCGDGYKAYTESKTIKTLKAGQKDSDFLNEAINIFKVEKSVVELPNDRALPRAKVFFCDTREILNKVASNNGADWSIQDNQLLMISKLSALKNDEDFILSRESGMIGSPQKTNKGLEVSALCNPHFKIGGLVRIDSKIKEYNGDYKIKTIQHTGDLIGSDWKSVLLCDAGQYLEV